MLKIQIVAAMFLAMSVQTAGAVEIVVEWTDDGESAPRYTFHLDRQPTDLDKTFTLNGYMVYSGSGNREAVMGSATFSPNEDLFVVSLFFNSSTGESFSIGADVDPKTLSGTGALNRMAHGGVITDRPGTLAVVPAGSNGGGVIGRNMSPKQ